MGAGGGIASHRIAVGPVVGLCPTRGVFHGRSKSKRQRRWWRAVMAQVLTRSSYLDAASATSRVGLVPETSEHRVGLHLKQVSDVYSIASFGVVPTSAPP